MYLHTSRRRARVVQSRFIPNLGTYVIITLALHLHRRPSSHLTVIYMCGVDDDDDDDYQQQSNTNLPTYLHQGAFQHHSTYTQHTLHTHPTVHVDVAYLRIHAS